MPSESPVADEILRLAAKGVEKSQIAQRVGCALSYTYRVVSDNEKDRQRRRAERKARATD